MDPKNLPSESEQPFISTLHNKRGAKVNLPFTFKIRATSTVPVPVIIFLFEYRLTEQFKKFVSRNCHPKKKLLIQCCGAGALTERDAAQSMATLKSFR
jgi:hypothetical protein